MTKADFIDRVAERAQLTRQEALRAVDAALGTVCDILAEGGHVSLTGFGRFHVSELAGRAGVNPRTGQSIQVPATRVPRLTPGTRLKQAARASAGRSAADV